MTNERRRAADEGVRAILRLGDPAASEEPLSPADVARMRRTVLVEAAEGRRPRALRLVPALAAVALVALVVWLSRSGPGDRPIDPAPERPVAEVAVEPPAVESAAPPTASSTHTRPAAPKPRPAQPASGDSLAVARERSPRTIRFVTNSGTQIIWTLDPGLEI